jgi:hypothetical protein
MFRTGAVIAAAVFLIAAIPIPRSSIISEQQGPEHSVGTQSNTAQSEQSAKAAPLSVVPKIPPKPSYGSAPEKPKNHDSHGVDWPSWVEAFAAIATATFTGLLFVATIRLWDSTKGLHDETKRLAELAESQSADMKESISVTKSLAEANQASVRIARQEFVSTHRPRIILREAIIGSVCEGEKISVILTLSNVGETIGTIVRSVVDLEIIARGQNYYKGLTDCEPHNEVGNFALAPGESRRVRFGTINKRPNSSEEPVWEADFYGWKERAISSDPTDPKFERYKDRAIHLKGQFLYQDDIELMRRTAFRRELDPERQRFYRIEGEPDLDYAD